MKIKQKHLLGSLSGNRADFNVNHGRAGVFTKIYNYNHKYVIFYFQHRDSGNDDNDNKIIHIIKNNYHT